MKSKLFLLTVLFLSGSVLGVNAQILEGYAKSKVGVAKNRAVYDADKEVDSQINKGVDKQFNKLKDKILEKDEKPAEGTTGETKPAEPEAAPKSSGSSGSSASDDAMSRAIMGKMGINMTRPANMKDVYEYSGNIVMDVENWDQDGESEGKVAYTTQYSDKNNGIAMVFKDEEKGLSTMIFDYDNMLMLVLADNGSSDRSGFATPLNSYYSDSASTTSNSEVSKAEAENAANYNSAFKKTGKSKTIAGYKCEEYFFEDEQDKVSYWLTTDLPTDLWSKMYTSNAFTSLYTGRTNGFVMESDHQYKASKERSYMIVKEVNPKQSSKISTVGYTIMTMNAPAPAPEDTKKEGKEGKK
jgi:hypothetical protein